MEITFKEWKNEIKRLLIHKDAIKLTSAKTVWPMWYECSFPPKEIAKLLNERYSAQENKYV